MSVSDEYSAGIIDGEGCITITWKHIYPAFHLSVELKSDDYADQLLGELYDVYGGGLSNRGNRNRTIWQVSDRNELYIVLTKVYPFIRIKVRQVELMLDALDFVLKKGHYVRWSNKDILYIAELSDEISRLNGKQGRKRWTKEYIESLI